MDIDELSNNLLNIVNAKDSILEGSKVEMSVVDTFFKLFPNHRSAHIEAAINRELPENSGIFDIANISLSNQSSYYFQRFRGRNLFYCEAKMDTSDIIDFLNKIIGYCPKQIPLRNTMFYEIKRKIDERKGYINFENDDFELFIPSTTE
ncbi:hypothetical protein L3Y34_015104 [Caenorhabditis briggsae]|uniref:Uncharacterized protein n=1 Tax=Caenorhabditis briggsae TaxID=6238 RepID=A0AAE9DT56_CAEBR|nr:hypothetical protein L3Y34_015104 [Caenorhabditis briggsae]